MSDTHLIQQQVRGPEKMHPVGKIKEKSENRKNFLHVKQIFTENVNFTETFDVTLLPKIFCKNHISFLTVYAFSCKIYVACGE
jgi:hypothetical protein